MRAERRPHLRRPCPLHEEAGCDWWQVTSWFMGGPDTTQEVDPLFLRIEAEEHLTSVHYPVAKQYFT